MYLEILERFCKYTLDHPDQDTFFLLGRFLKTLNDSELKFVYDREFLLMETAEHYRNTPKELRSLYIPVEGFRKTESEVAKS